MQTFTGIVQKGSQRGKTLGFPTANISLSDMEISGIYAARVVIDGKEFQAAAFADQKRNILEAYIFDFSDNLYGKEIEITLEKKIREAQIFDNDVALRAAITRDVNDVRGYFRAIKTL